LSLPEVLLWQHLKGGPQGISFRKQHPIGAYRVDFYCAAANLVIEVDGIVHDMGDRPARDAARNAELSKKGYRVLRIPATEVLRDPRAVATSILAVASRPLHRPCGAVPLPASGEDPIA
jgi:very-short-patch-repair endonuclease